MLYNPLFLVRPTLVFIDLFEVMFCLNVIHVDNHLKMVGYEMGLNNVKNTPYRWGKEFQRIICRTFMAEVIFIEKN